ncbi:MAG: hypothetical protein LBO63_03855 [Oscillospiraceae bacterium]|nr:hypothetical protein [Oscillospiraceae bacterium]
MKLNMLLLCAILVLLCVALVTCGIDPPGYDPIPEKREQFAEYKPQLQLITDFIISTMPAPPAEKTEYFACFLDFNSGTLHYYDHTEEGSKSTEVEISDTVADAIISLKSLYTRRLEFDCIYYHKNQMDFVSMEAMNVFTYMLVNKRPQYYYRGKRYKDYRIYELGDRWYYSSNR